MVTISTNGSNGPWIYGGDSDGLDSNAEYGPAANAKTNTKKSNIKFGYGNGIVSKGVIGIDSGWGENNGRIVGDMKAENQNNAKWVNFNEKGHNSAQMDNHYEIAIPLDELGTTADNIATYGLGIELAATFGLSAMDSLPYDLAMNDNADLPDTGSQVNNSFEKSDEDMSTVKMANIGGTGPIIETKSVKIDQSDYSVDLSNGVTTKQLTATTDPKGASVSWSSSNKGRSNRQLEGCGHPEESRQGHGHREVRDQDLVDHRDRDGPASAGPGREEHRLRHQAFGLGQDVRVRVHRRRRYRGEQRGLSGRGDDRPERDRRLRRDRPV